MYSDIILAHTISVPCSLRRIFFQRTQASLPTVKRKKHTKYKARLKQNGKCAAAVEMRGPQSRGTVVDGYPQISGRCAAAVETGGPQSRGAAVDEYPQISEKKNASYFEAASYKKNQKDRYFSFCYPALRTEGLYEICRCLSGATAISRQRQRNWLFNIPISASRRLSPLGLRERTLLLV